MSVHILHFVTLIVTSHSATPYYSNVDTKNTLLIPLLAFLHNTNNKFSPYNTHSFISLARIYTLNNTHLRFITYKPFFVELARLQVTM
jgi:hypothetical protein